MMAFGKFFVGQGWAKVVVMPIEQGKSLLFDFRIETIIVGLASFLRDQTTHTVSAIGGPDAFDLPDTETKGFGSFFGVNLFASSRCMISRRVISAELIVSLSLTFTCASGGWTFIIKGTLILCANSSCLGLDISARCGNVGLLTIGRHELGHFSMVIILA
jgi:hypothetical protein